MENVWWIGDHLGRLTQVALKRYIQNATLLISPIKSKFSRQDFRELQATGEAQ